MTEKQIIEIGQRLSVGFDGPVIPQEFIDLVKKYKVGNVILFRRNVFSFSQLRALCADIRALIRAETGFEPFIMIDEECGRVSRLSHIACQTPCAMAIGATDDPGNAYGIGKLIGQELRAAGVNFNLAPVLDCLTNPAAPHGNRCFAAEPEKTAEFGVAYLRGLQEQGVLACAKHFPGQGDTAVDSHLGLPVVDKPAEAVWQTELVSFQAAVKAGIQGIMSAHVVFPAFEKEHVPGTVSRSVITGLIREQMGFTGIILSDGMEMNAVRDMFGIPDGTRRALAAGVDVALICHSAEDAAKTCEHLYAALENGAFDAAEAEARYRHIVDCKSRLLPPEGGEEMFGSPAQRAFAARVMRDSLRLTHAPGGRPLPAVDETTVFLGVNARAETPASDNEPLDAAKECAAAFGGTRIALDGNAPDGAKKAVVFLSKHPDLEKAVAAANRLAAAGLQVLAVSMNVPVCLRGLDDGIWQAEAWQYDVLGLGALIAAFRERSL